MNTPLIITGAIVAAVVGIGAIGYVSSYNMANRMERSIVATDENNRNILAQYGNKVAEAAQIPAMQRDDVAAVVTAAIQGRYGNDGSKAVFQMIQEQNPSVDPTVYIQLQRIIESGRNEFSSAQTKLVDQKRVYETALGSLWTGTWMSVAGYPKIDLTEYQIVSTSRADEAFKTGIEEAMKLR